METTTAESSPTDCVKVAVRVRPLIARERGCTDISIICDTKANEIIIDGNDDKRFTYNYVFDTDSKQEDIYTTCVVPLLDSAFEGYNATILAYGQTGSGKTYTMGTAGRVTNPSDVGIVPRVIEDIFQRKAAIEKEHPTYEIVIHVSFLEIYAENVRDLLEMDQSQTKEVLIRSDDQGGVKVIGQKTQQVTSAEELLDILDTGSLYRATGQTSMNAFSSRSHAIFTIYIDQEIPVQLEGDNAEVERHSDIRQSKFHFVDLAGSERASRTNSEGQRMKEGIDINRGLLALGKVIRALGDEKNKGTYPPYRDSKLTRLLMDSLGGNAKTLMITCVSPASDSLNESLGSLRYANSAKNIQNKPKVNKDKNSSLIIALKQEVQQLRELLAAKDIDPQLLEKLASQRIDQKEEETCVEKDEEEREKLEERAREAENTVKRLQEKNKALEKQLEEERNKNALLEAKIKYHQLKEGKGEIEDLSEDLSEDVMKEVNLLAKQIARTKELEQQLQKKNEEILELIHLNEEQNSRNVNDKMEIIDLRYRSRAEVECEAVNRLREALTNERDENDEVSPVQTTDDVASMNGIFEETNKEINSQHSMLSKELDILVDGIREREKDLYRMKRDQANYEATAEHYENELSKMTMKINQMETEKNKLKQEMEQLLQQQKLHPVGGKEVSKKQIELENKLKMKTDEIAKIKSQKKELEKKVEGFRSTSQNINRLTKNIEEMKAKKVALQRSIENAQRQHKQQLEEKKREIQFLEKQKREQLKKINELQLSSRKASALLQKKLDENTQLQKQVKELKLSYEVQRREHERYSKEDQKRLHWLEKQLNEEKKKDLVINQLERKLDQKQAAIQKYKELLKEREIKQRKKKMMRVMEPDTAESTEQEEIEDAIEDICTQINIEAKSVEDIEMLLRDKDINEQKVMSYFKSLKTEEAIDMLCVVYKKLVDYMKELNELSKTLGMKEENISEMSQQIKQLQKTIHSQKLQFERSTKLIREQYEPRIYELEKQREQASDGLNADSQNKMARAYFELKKRYKQLTEDYVVMKECRNRYRMLYIQMREEREDELSSTSSQSKSEKPSPSVSNVAYSQDMFHRFVESLKNTPTMDMINKK